MRELCRVSTVIVSVVSVVSIVSSANQIEIIVSSVMNCKHCILW